MKGDFHVRFCGKIGVKFPCLTRLPAIFKPCKMSNHPLKCPECGDFKKLELVWVRYKEKVKKELDLLIPFLVCPTCGHKKSFYEKEYYDETTQKFFKEMKDGEKSSITFGYEEKEFSRYSSLELKYDSVDYYLIPGLYRPEDDGFLTPVFFDKDVLLYYNSHPDYKVRFSSFSSGNIYYKGNPLFNWGFGINRNGKIFMWLGDLKVDFKKEEMKSHLKRFQASNVDSDHDIYSKFYLMQNPFSPSDAFQDSDNEVKLFRLKNELDDIFEEKFSFRLTKIHIEDLFDFYKPPILEEKEQVFGAYISLTNLIIENIEIQKLKQNIQDGENNKEIKQLGTLKTLERFFTNKLNVDETKVKEIMSPLYVLYDLRLLHGHFSDSSFEERYSFCQKRLELEDGVSHFQVYERLIEKLIETFKELKKTAGNS